MRSFLFLLYFFLLSSLTNAECPPDATLEKWLSANSYTKAMAYVETKLPASNQKKEVACDCYYLVKASYLHNRMGKIPRAKWLAQEAMRRLHGSQDSVLVMEAMAMEAYANHSMGKLDESLKGILNVLEYAYRHKNLSLEYKCITLLGGIELHYGRLEQMLKYYFRALQLSKSIPLPEHIPNSQMSYAYALIASGQSKEGQKLLDQSLALAIHNKDTITQAVINLLESNRMSTENPLSNWQEKTNKVIQLASAISHERLLSMAYGQIMEYYLIQKKYTEAITTGKQALTTAEKQHIPLVEAYLDSLMFVVYKKMGNEAEALSYFEKFYKNQKIITSEEQISLLNDQKFAFETREKSLTIENQKLMLENVNKQKLLLVMLVIFLASLILWLLIQRWRTSRRRTELYQKEKMIESIFDEEKNRKTPAQAQIDHVSIPDKLDINPEIPDMDALPEDRKDLYQELLHLIESQKLYLNPQLDQKLMIMLLGTNRTYLYQAISVHAKSNFKNIINMYRVREVKRKIEHSVRHGSDYFPEQVYAEAGFNSLASYYRIFKQFTGLTPMEYMQEYEKEYASQQTL